MAHHEGVYDFMLAPNFPENAAPSSREHAIQLITETDQQVDPATQPAANDASMTSSSTGTSTTSTTHTR